jgi:hypothetical protein
MGKTILIGLEPNELQWLRSLVTLLRHPDPSVPELARQALLHVTETAGKRSISRPEGPEQPQIRVIPPK